MMDGEYLVRVQDAVLLLLLLESQIMGCRQWTCPFGNQYVAPSVCSLDVVVWGRRLCFVS
jgi:hypothetical protein